nr:pyruvate, phosphate dikinase [Myxococcota bacterium]
MTRYLVIPGAPSASERGEPEGAAGPERVGAKAAGLIDAAGAGLPVPPFFVLSLELFRAWRAAGGALPPDLEGELDAGLEHLARATGARFGDTEAAPLIVSVRSGAPVSMPGMLDTVLDVGASSAVVDALAKQLGDRGTALDVRRRFLESFGAVVR